MKLWIKNGRVLNPADGTDNVRDIFIEDGVFTDTPGGEILDATGLVVAPGLVDIHCHLRDPGFTHKEDVESGTRSAAKGGFTSIACMPNTRPPIDNPELVRELKNRPASVHVYPIAAITRGMQGTELTDFLALRDAGAVAVSDDGLPVTSAARMREALLAAQEAGLAVVSHCEEPTLGAGVIHDGAVARELGVAGITPAAEEIMVAREIVLASTTGAPVHIAHVSTRGSVAMIRDAKRRGIRVTCETCPHYFSLTEEACRTRDANTKMNPPLRTRDDLEAIIEGLQDGTIDAIATDHAPHTPEEKRDFERAPNGILGFETALAVGITCLVKPGYLTLLELIRRMTENPARIFHLPAGEIKPGAPADLVLFDPDAIWMVREEEIASKSRNTPYLGRELQGRVIKTIVDGKTV